MRTSRTVWSRRIAGVVLGLIALLPACGDGRSSLPTSTQTYDSQGRLLADVPPPEQRPNLILIVIDSLRADALPPAKAPTGEQASERMPYLASLARRGVRFDQAAASASWTLPSMVSLLTGLQPSAHGQHQVHAGGHLPGAITTYPEVLQAGYGYDTAAYVGGRLSRRPSANVLQGFSTHRASFSLRDADATIARWDATRTKGKPFFLLLHAQDAQEPYGQGNHTPPETPGLHPPLDAALLAEDADPAELLRVSYLDAAAGLALDDVLGHRLHGTLQRYRSRGFAENPSEELAGELERAYWDGLRWVDRLLEATVRSLEERGLLENTLLVVTSDHGESFGEHGTLGRGFALYDELLKVPLVMVGPPPFDAARVVSDSMGLLDVLPTFLDWADIQPLLGVDGRSAMGLVRGGSWCRPLIAEERLTRTNTGDDVDAALLSVRTPTWKYIATFDLQKGTVHEEAYDLAVDPGERRDVGRGTGQLPEPFVFDGCICPAIEEIRDRIWDDPETASDEPYAMPYGTSAPRASTPRPAPCTPKR